MREINIGEVHASAYTVPTDAPESDGTLQWSATTLVLVQVEAAGRTGIGYTYADAATARFISDHLAPIVTGRSVLDTAASWDAMRHAIRNLGRPGVASMAMAAVDVALWDLKARVLELPLVSLLGAARDSVELYGSGGFTSYDDARLVAQLSGWARSGFRRVKMKIGRDDARDLDRVRMVRDAIGPDVELFVDANGAYDGARALRMAEAMAPLRVTWFEEPVSSDDLSGLQWLRGRVPAGMRVAAGEYGYDLPYFRRMLESGAVDVLQADATRCAGITEFLRVGALCEAFGMALSAHTAPALHLHVACAIPRLVHVEFFYDHARLERLLFVGVPEPVDGRMAPDVSRAGMGLEWKAADAERYRVS